VSSQVSSIFSTAKSSFFSHHHATTQTNPKPALCKHYNPSTTNKYNPMLAHPSIHPSINQRTKWLPALRTVGRETSHKKFPFIFQGRRDLFGKGRTPSSVATTTTTWFLLLLLVQRLQSERLFRSHATFVLVVVVGLVLARRHLECRGHRVLLVLLLCSSSFYGSVFVAAAVVLFERRRRRLLVVVTFASLVPLNGTLAPSSSVHASKQPT